MKCWICSDKYETTLCNLDKIVVIEADESLYNDSTKTYYLRVFYSIPIMSAPVKNCFEIYYKDKNMRDLDYRGLIGIIGEEM